MKQLLYLSIFILPFFISSCKGPKTAKKPKVRGIEFAQSETLSALLDQAALENKLVFIDIYTSWCLPCKMMDQDVFPDQELGDFFNKNFINYKVNAEKGNGANIAFVYQVEAYPTLLFVDAKGKVLEKKIGAAYQTEMMQMALRALDSQL